MDDNGAVVTCRHIMSIVVSWNPYNEFEICDATIQW